VDRPTTGRRHVRAGSVHVTELIEKQASRPEPPARSVHPFREPVEPLPEQGAHRRPPSKGAQAAKLTGLGIATIVLCGAVAMASMIANRRPDNAQPSTPGLEITGEQALLPDQLNRTIPPGETFGSPAVPAGAPILAPDHADEVTEDTTKGPSTGRGGAAEGNTSASDASGSEIAPPTDLDLVRQFYSSLPSAPETAFELLAPGLLDTSLGEFLESWTTVSSIDDLQVTQRGDDVLAVVGMRLADGSGLRIQQLMTVAESPRRIAGVQLLSAQRH
jgi:hypothetical protein